jgi:hypothetical protein
MLSDRGLAPTAINTAPLRGAECAKHHVHHVNHFNHSSDRKTASPPTIIATNPNRPSINTAFIATNTNRASIDTAFIVANANRASIDTAFVVANVNRASIDIGNNKSNSTEEQFYIHNTLKLKK